MMAHPENLGTRNTQKSRLTNEQANIIARIGVGKLLVILGGGFGDHVRLHSRGACQKSVRQEGFGGCRVRRLSGSDWSRVQSDSVSGFWASGKAGLRVRKCGYKFAGQEASRPTKFGEERRTLERLAVKEGNERL
jgi:hypothetical protein